MPKPCLPPSWPIDSDWTPILTDAFERADFQTLKNFIHDERQQCEVFPLQANVFNAFRWTNFADVKVVVLGQDPYHGAEQAHGLSFSVPVGQKLPPSLRNIYQELQTDLGCGEPVSGNLESWARQGVMLLNTVLTVRSGEANSHRKRGWESFTDEVIRQLSRRRQPIVFFLWGKPAQKKAALIQDPHIVFESPHPSPLSAYRGFFGSRPFSMANAALVDSDQTPIDWTSVCR